MIKVDVKGCSTFVDAAKYESYVAKALDAFDVLKNETGAGNDFLGWKTLPVDIPESLVKDCEAIRDDWAARGVNLVVVIGIGEPQMRGAGLGCELLALQRMVIEQVQFMGCGKVQNVQVHVGSCSHIKCLGGRCVARFLAAYERVIFYGRLTAQLAYVALHVCVDD